MPRKTTTDPALALLTTSDAPKATTKAPAEVVVTLADLKPRLQKILRAMLGAEVRVTAATVNGVIDAAITEACDAARADLERKAATLGADLKVIGGVDRFGPKDVRVKDAGTSVRVYGVRSGVPFAGVKIGGTIGTALRRALVAGE